MFHRSTVLGFGAVLFCGLLHRYTKIKHERQAVCIHLTRRGTDCRFSLIPYQSIATSCDGRRQSGPKWHLLSALPKGAAVFPRAIVLGFQSGAVLRTSASRKTSSMHPLEEKSLQLWLATGTDCRFSLIPYQSHGRLPPPVTVAGCQAPSGICFRHYPRELQCSIAQPCYNSERCCFADFCVVTERQARKTSSMHPLDEKSLQLWLATGTDCRFSLIPYQSHGRLPPPVTVAGCQAPSGICFRHYPRELQRSIAQPCYDSERCCFADVCIVTERQARKTSSMHPLDEKSLQLWLATGTDCRFSLIPYQSHGRLPPPVTVAGCQAPSGICFRHYPRELQCSIAQPC